MKDQGLEPKKFDVSMRHGKVLRRHGFLLKDGVRVVVHGELDSNKGIDCKLLIVLGEGGEINVLLDPNELRIRKRIIYVRKS
jgi:hypothetical protein